VCVRINATIKIEKMKKRKTKMEDDRVSCRTKKFSILA